MNYEIEKFLKKIEEKEIPADFINNSLNFFSAPDQPRRFFYGLNSFENPLLKEIIGHSSFIVDASHSKIKIDNEQFLRTFLLLIKDGSFSHWSDFFNLVFQIKSESTLEKFMHTTRFLALNKNFHAWETYLKSVHSTFKKSDKFIDLFFQTTRKIVKYFSSQNSFSSVFSILSEAHSENIFNAFSHGQLTSKCWLIETLKSSVGHRFGHIQLVGGWIGVLPLMLFDDEDLQIGDLISIDKDFDSCRMAELLNKNSLELKRFRAVCADATQKDISNVYDVRDGGVPDLVINTSCEHFENLLDWWIQIPTGKLVALQSNNAFGHSGHLNCVNNLNEFKALVPMKKIFYGGELDLGNYTRFMLIGEK